MTPATELDRLFAPALADTEKPGAPIPEGPQPTPTNPSDLEIER